MTDPTHMRRIQKNYTQDQQSQDLDDQLKQENSFEGGNKIYELNSKINTLKIEKNKLSLEHQAAIQSMQSKNQQLNQQLNNLKRQNNKLTTNIRKLEIENDQLKRINDGYRQQIQLSNRRTADFHRSIDDKSGLGDPRDIINEVIAKDKRIQQLQKKLQSLQHRPNSSVSSSVNIAAQQQRERYQQDIRTLRNTIEELKKKQIAYKRQYQSMIQAKEDIIKKMSNQNDQYSRKIGQSKDKIISQLRRQHQQLQRKVENYKIESSGLTQKLLLNEKQLGKIKNQYRKKQESLINHFENQKDDIARGLNQKLKKIIKQKQQKLGRSEDKLLQLQNTILIMKQQLNKNKAEVISLNQFNAYLQTSNKQSEQTKKKLQSALYEKQKEIGQLRQSYFVQISQMKKSMIQERAQFQQKIAGAEQQILNKVLIIQKYEKDILQMERRQDQHAKVQHEHYQKDYQRLQKQNQQLNKQLESLHQRYRQKTQKLHNTQKKVRKQYEQRVSSLEKQLLKQREQGKQRQLQLQQLRQNLQKRQVPISIPMVSSSMPPLISLQTRQKQVSGYQSSSQGGQTSSTISKQQFQKYVNISELRKIEIQQKQTEIRKVNEQKSRLERQNARTKEECANLQRKIKQKIQDYKSLQLSFEELSDKYRRGVKQLQNKMQSMEQQISQQRKKTQKRKNQALQIQANLTLQIKSFKSKTKQLELSNTQYKQKIRQLQKQLQVYKTRKVEQAQYADLKLQKLAHEISLINKEKQSAIKTQELRTRQQQQVLIEEKKKLLQYIQQLQQNNQILNKKLSIMEMHSNNSTNRDKKNITSVEKQLREIKVQYSQSLKEVNLILQKYKKLEDIHRETLISIQDLKQEKQSINKKYLQLFKQKNKLFQQLNSAYDQINKLNHVLMSKEEQLARNRTLNCQHFDTKPKSMYGAVSNLNMNHNNYQNQYTNQYTGSQPILQGPGFSNPNLNKNKSPPKYFDRGQNIYATNANLANRSSYTRYG